MICCTTPAQILENRAWQCTVALTVKIAQKQIRDPMNKSSIKQWAVFLRMLWESIFQLYGGLLPLIVKWKRAYVHFHLYTFFSCLIFANQNFSKLPTATRQRHFLHNKKATGRWSHFKTERVLIYTFFCTTWLMMFEWAHCFVSVPSDC